MSYSAKRAQGGVCRGMTPLAPNAVMDAKSLEKIRDLGRKCRLFGAQSGDPVLVFLSKLHEALGRRPVFFEATSKEVSFDEAWLLNLFDAIKTQDHDRYCFAMRSRMSRGDASGLHFLAIKAAHTLDRT